MMSHLDHHQAYYYRDSRSYEREHEHEHYRHHQPMPARQAGFRPEAPQAPKNKEQPKQAQSQEEEVASFLLSLKHNHRSITPEPLADKAIVPSALAVADVKPTAIPANMPPIQLEKLLHMSNSMLVCIKDTELVPDALFLAMAQMVPTRMSYQDRVGCYKSRAVGYLGMCCKHCGGQPGFGRYFPNSVRSLAQTTTSQTILKHVGAKCRHCPEELKRAISQLQRQQDQRETVNGKPRYGSRKVFFQRVWDRLNRFEDDRLDLVENVPLPAHNESSCSYVPVATTSSAYFKDSRNRYYEADAKYDDASSSSQTPSDVDEDHQTLDAWPSADTDDANKKSKYDLA